jgi:hypothetical protein
VSGFANPLVGGGGALVYPAIHSPNYVLNVSGWSINKDGTAQFTGVVLIGGTLTGTNFIINSSGAFFYTGTPANGNLFCSIAAAAGADGFGNAYGSGVNVGNQAGAHLAISTLGDLLVANAANLPVAFLYHGDGSLRLYNPAGIAAGNLQTVISPATGVDSAGNPYSAGFSSIHANGPVINVNDGFIFFTSINALTQIIQQGNITITDSTNVAVPPALSMSAPSAVVNRTAQLELFGESNDTTAGPQASLVTPNASLNLLGGSANVQPADGNTYDLARLTLATSGGTVSLVAFTTIGGLTKNVGIGRYKFRVHIMYVGNGVGVAASPLFRMRSPAFSSGSLSLTGLANGPLVSVRFDNTSGFGSSMAAPALIAGDTTTRYNVVIEGSAVFTAAGGFDVQASIGAAGNAQFVIAAGSTFELYPVVAA